MSMRNGISGVKHRFLIFLYITCLTLSLTPSIVAPPERGFYANQPEMNQAVKNMVLSGSMVKKDLDFPSGDVEGYPALLTFKTSNLLSEAEHMLNRVKNVKERRWVEAFIHRMKMLSTVLDKSVTPRYPSKNEMITQYSTKNELISSPRNMLAANETPIPAGSSSQPTKQLVPAVPAQNTNQKSSKSVKYPVTSPEVSHVNDYPTERQVVTKPATSDKNAEEDELVRELQNLHNEKLAASDRDHQNMKPFTVSRKSTEPTTPATPASAENVKGRNLMVEKEKAKIKARLSQEIAELQRLGGTQDEIMNALHLDDLKFADFTNPNFVFNQKQNVEEGANKFEIAEDDTEDEESMQRLRDVKNEEMISRPDSSVWNSAMDSIHYPAESSQVKEKSLSLQTHVNSGSQEMSQNDIHAHSGGLENEIKNLQRPIHPNFIMKNRIMQLPKAYPNILHHMDVSDAMRKNQLSQVHNKFQNDRLALPYYPEYFARYGYGPYPYLHHWENKNSTIHEPQMMPPFSPKSFPDHHIDTQLSEEMKRQLRDGKILVMSDSLVRSNFETKEKDKEAEAKGKPDAKDKPDAGNTKVNKNDTQAQN